MAASELIAAGSTAASSAEFPVAAGEVVPICLKAFELNARAVIELKDDAGGFNVVGLLTSGQTALAINAPGTYRVTRRAGSDRASCGVFRG